ncbi:MAG: phage portal protein [Oscillospiraceae bacterium]|nr:phage portal protein [Oscillospiraceae bacterium]
MIFLTIDPGSVLGLTTYEAEILQDLLKIYSMHQVKNEEKQRYYEGKINLNSVNLGIALPKGMQGLEIGCSWGAKCVDVLAARSMFDGFVDMNGAAVPEINQLVRDNNLLSEYMKTTKDELKFGCSFATLSKDDQIGCKIRFHSPQTAAARWDGNRGRIAYGMAIINVAPLIQRPDIIMPSVIYLYLSDTIIVLRRADDSTWISEHYPHQMGRPLMEPLIWSSTSAKPLGRSRIKEPVRRLIDGYVRTIANASIGLEFSTAPQKYILGVTDEQFDQISADKFHQYVGSIIAATTNPETGEKPTFGQLTQGNISPHTEMIRILATQFSAATGLPVTDTGVVNDANPTSSDAILAQTQTLVSMAEDLNAGNGNTLRTIALMALAISRNTNLEGLSDEDKDIVAHFRNPAMPSVAVTADAAIKIASSRQGFAATDTFLEMIGFDQADIRRIKAQEALQRGRAVLSELDIV